MALILAYFLPFKLFVLAYSILGPLHYLTEINWLEKKNFFILDRKKVYLLILLAVIMSMPFAIFKTMGFDFGNPDKSGIETILYFLLSHSTVLIFASFALALILIIFREFWKIIAYVFAAIGLGLFIMDNHIFILVIGILLPTIIHVYVFTMLFML